MLQVGASKEDDFYNHNYNPPFPTSIMSSTHHHYFHTLLIPQIPYHTLLCNIYIFTIYTFFFTHTHLLTVNIFLSSFWPLGFYVNFLGCIYLFY